MNVPTLEPWLAETVSLLDLKPKTRESYGSLSRLLVSRLGDVPLGSLTPLDVQRFASGSGVSASRTRQAHCLLRQSMRMAVQYGLVDASPCEVTRLPRLPRGEVAPLSRAQLEDVAAACGRYRPLVLLLGLTGMRWGEATGLRWEDVEPPLVRVRRTLVEIGGRVSEGTPKSHQARRVYLPSGLDLDERGDGLVFSAPRGGPIRHSNFRSRVWLPALAEAGVPAVKIHALRHTAASLMMEAGVSPLTVQKVLGHSSVNMTMAVYGHVNDRQLRDAARALEAL